MTHNEQIKTTVPLKTKRAKSRGMVQSQQSELERTLDTMRRCDEDSARSIEQLFDL
jgi:hypothetical protein